MLPAERFLGSGHQTKETEIEANFLWQVATTPMPRRHVLQKALVSLFKRIQDTFLFRHYFCANSCKPSKRKQQITKKIASVLLSRATTSGYCLLSSFVLSLCWRKLGLWQGCCHPGDAHTWGAPFPCCPPGQTTHAKPHRNPECGLFPMQSDANRIINWKQGSSKH